MSTPSTNPHLRALKLAERMADLLQRRALGEIEIKADDIKVRVAAPNQALVGAAAPAQAVAVPLAPAAAPPAAAEEEDAVRAPMVGTAYLSPEPGAEPFVRVGEQVRAGQPVLIIEAMKTMNHIAAPRDGVVHKVLVANGQPVEFDELLALIG